MSAENQQPEAQKDVAPASGSFSLTAGLGGIVGLKAGMTQVYSEEGDQQAVTVIDCQPNVVTQIRTLEKDGYVGVQVGLLHKKEKNCSLAEQGHAKKSGAKGYRHYEEFRLPNNAKLDGLAVGQTLSLDFIKPGDYVDVTSFSKGKGFQGAMKRYNFSGLPRSHGVSVSHRSLGSCGNRASPGRTWKNKKMPGQMGNRASPGRTWKNKKMPGQMGNRRVTMMNSRVLRVDKENNIIMIHGSVPGSRAGLVTIRRAVKKQLQSKK